MPILIFIVVIVVLIVAHELGHFIAAKLSGMRVDEFGLGYPPRAIMLGKIGETEYTLNWIPFGGFVRIFGEDGDGGIRAFYTRPRVLQAIVLAAGVAMNIVLAYALITAALVSGTPRGLSDAEVPMASGVELAVSNVLHGSPADRAGIIPGDSIISAKDAKGEWRAADPKSFSSFVANSGGETITLAVKHEGRLTSLNATPATGVSSSGPSRYALGVEIATIGVVPLGLGAALVEGASLTWGTIVLTAKGLWNFFHGVITFSADFSQVAGPVGIAGVIGGVSRQGIGDLFSLIAVLSVNLALINLIPIPALDGGRLLFVIIEGVTRRPIKQTVAQAINTAGFAFLILLMVIVTAHDIFKIVR